jgi:hypothetical protein
MNSGTFSIVVLVKGPEDDTKLEGDVGEIAPGMPWMIAFAVAVLAVALVLFAYRQHPENAWADTTIKWTAQVAAFVSIVAVMLILYEQWDAPATVISLVCAVVLPVAAQLNRPRYLVADENWPEKRLSAALCATSSSAREAWAASLCRCKFASRLRFAVAQFMRRLPARGSCGRGGRLRLSDRGTRRCGGMKRLPPGALTGATPRRRRRRRARFL